jgi:hypothetical protein
MPRPLLVGLCLLASHPAFAWQRPIPRVEQMPNLPEPFCMKDWNRIARDYDALAFDLSAKGQYLPLVWLDDSHVNCDGPGFGMPSYVGDERMSGPNAEGITCMGAVLGATVAGIDKHSGPHDWVAMCRQWFNRETGENLVLNNQRGDTGGSFWYEIWPNIVYYALCDRYPDTPGMADEVPTVADRWRDACEAMGCGTPNANLDHTAFDFDTMRPVDNGLWREPDGAAGIAWLEYAAWKRSGDVRHLRAAEWCLTWLHERRANPFYENLMPWGTLAAARMNAERGTWYETDKFINWCFGISECRGGWGVIADNWDGYDCHGLLGSVDDNGGYAFAMNTFTQAGALVPLVRYDDRYARAIGKWMLNAANAARLFYPDAWPARNQSSASWTGDPLHVIAYEGLRKEWNGRSPVATGDPVRMDWGPKTDLGLYGSSYVGFFGGIIAPTSDPRILRLDCLATDFFRDPAYPTYLYYNPYRKPKTVGLDVGPEPKDVYDATRDAFVARRVRGKTSLHLAPDNAALIVLAPAGGKVRRDGMRTLVDGVVVDYVTATPWTPDLVRPTEAWHIHMNEALVSGAPNGLRVEVAPGKTWAIASIPEFLIPDWARTLTIRVPELGGGAKWSVKLLGDLNGDGHFDIHTEHWLPLRAGSRRELLSVQLHPGLRQNLARPLERLELVVEGPPGAYAIFGEVSFAP